MKHRHRPHLLVLTFCGIWFFVSSGGDFLRREGGGKEKLYEAKSELAIELDFKKIDRARYALWFCLTIDGGSFLLIALTIGLSKWNDIPIYWHSLFEQGARHRSRTRFDRRNGWPNKGHAHRRRR